MSVPSSMAGMKEACPACGHLAVIPSTDSASVPSLTKPLVVYYSRSGNTKLVAEKLANILDADLEEIQEAKDRHGVFGWLGARWDAMMKRPTELTSQHSTEGRTLMILGMPIWVRNPPPAIRQYISAVGLAGRKTAAFCLHGGVGGEKTLTRLTELLPAGLIETLEIKKLANDPDLDEKLRDWAQRLHQAV